MIRTFVFALVAALALSSSALAEPITNHEAVSLPDVAPEGDALRVQLAASRVREAEAVLQIAQRDLEDARAALRASAKITDGDKVSAFPPYKIQRAEKKKAELWTPSNGPALSITPSTLLHERHTTKPKLARSDRNVSVSTVNQTGGVTAGVITGGK